MLSYTGIMRNAIGIVYRYSIHGIIQVQDRSIVVILMAGAGATLEM